MAPQVQKQRGFTLIEVMVALVIVTGSMVSLLTVVGNATDDVIRTVRQRKLRYLMQLQLGDLETRASMESSEESEGLVYEEGMRGDFRDFESKDVPGEYDQYEWRIPVFRDEIIAGASANDEELLEAGFVEDSQGRITGRPVTRGAYLDAEGSEEEEAGPPPGQVKRVLIFSVRFVGETVEDDLEYAIMTYLPFPGEEEQSSGGEGEGEGGGLGGLGGATDSTRRSEGAGSSTGDQAGGRR